MYPRQLSYKLLLQMYWAHRKKIRKTLKFSEVNAPACSTGATDSHSSSILTHSVQAQILGDWYTNAMHSSLGEGQLGLSSASLTTLERSPFSVSVSDKTDVPFPEHHPQRKPGVQGQSGAQRQNPTLYKALGFILTSTHTVLSRMHVYVLNAFKAILKERCKM